jgi:outer membrane murein-binding lipoprotein Lpp
MLGGLLKKYILGVLFLGGFFLSGCAQKAIENNLAAKVSEEPPVSGTQELQADAGALIEQANLTPQQKNQLKALQANTTSQIRIIREESLKLKSILIKDVFSTSYNKSEVKMIQNKIEKLENKRLAVIFETIDKANGIFGRETNAQENERIMHRLVMNHE